MNNNLDDKLIEVLIGLCPINKDIVEVIKDSLTLRRLPKGSQLITIGDVADKLYFIAKGLVRSYYFIDGKEVTSWLAAEDDFAVSSYSFFKQEPSFESVELLEDAELLFISYSDLQHLYQTHPSLNFIGRVLMEKYLLSAEERIRSLRMLNAEERYYIFCQQYPELCDRTPLKHIASYLGLSRYTLSRLRGYKFKMDLI
ncbi:Crp/Fnr family transcriptional regulator [Larkinella sp. VNQ87]|uniref:Crp/Fnr family transcriptional regulator n=1 Tax=Larkinella sp. VNQ87 TaxID=3400921 RepID=UPI003C09D6AE